jgi:hypothetical protein
LKGGFAFSGSSGAVDFSKVEGDDRIVVTPFTKNARDLGRKRAFFESGSKSYFEEEM